ncbi:MAG: MarR family EPS-associated transcriptional regulator [Bdellovibrionales bacterium]|jgi:EPS-associated MarR family transcriptional regulator|nr:MarR family EPS-associated transcriptional regulator [Bdellovibrionales bacterium]MBT3525216.1 MarR family EPS-associated transcriptional regulator [Bdellovibrionales bacterium]MBT7668258.1 MarR family EPS-associated transcriptional regulator [Bdellovibrionales bacterium]MBT7766408.1 MarR family EPS-associated transcriptional regulator [Bdellovibrionales bacterium]
MSSRQAKLQEDTYVRVMRLLEERPHISQRELARTLGVSLGGINYCMTALIDKGLVKVENFKRNKSGRLGYLYLLTPTGISEKTKLTASFLSRKMEEYEALKVEIEQLGGEF